MASRVSGLSSLRVWSMEVSRLGFATAKWKRDEKERIDLGSWIIGQLDYLAAGVGVRRG